MGLSLVVGITATLVVPPEPGAADQVSSLKTQAAEISRDLVLEQLQIGTYQQQYDVDVAKVQRDQAEIESTENQVQVDINQVKDYRDMINFGSAAPLYPAAAIAILTIGVNFIVDWMLSIHSRGQGEGA